MDTTDPVGSLTAALATAEAERDFSGIVRVSRGTEVLLESAHGLAERSHRVPVHPGTRFGVASLSKMFTAVAVLDAAGRGEVSLSAPLTEVLPEELRPARLHRAVTVAHLLEHRSGIADYFEEDEDLPGHQEDYAALWTDRPNASVRQDADLLPLFRELPRVGPPGDFHYSNAGYVLLGILLQQVSGMPFRRVMTERVFEPAGMAHSGYVGLDEVHPDVALGYIRPEGPGMPWRSNVFSVPAVGGGDGGAVLTAADVDRFLRAVDSGRVWGAPATESLRARSTDLGDGWGYGAGVFLAADGSFGHSGADPGVATWAFHLPRTDRSVVLLANVEDVPDAVYDALRMVLQDAPGGPR